MRIPKRELRELPHLRPYAPTYKQCVSARTQGVLSRLLLLSMSRPKAKEYQTELFYKKMYNQHSFIFSSLLLSVGTLFAIRDSSCRMRSLRLWTGHVLPAPRTLLVAGVCVSISNVANQEHREHSDRPDGSESTLSVGLNSGRTLSV